MAFSDFTFPQVVRDLGLTLVPATNLFPAVTPVPVGVHARAVMDVSGPLAATLNTEKARCEWLVAPVLMDFWRRYDSRIGLYSGANFAADPDAGLTGVCDFILGNAPQQSFVVAPVAVVFEAKREDIIGGQGQCIAAMVGAARFNRREGNPVPVVFGCVTSGSSWKFLRLDGATVTHDLREYSIAEADKLLGIFTHMIGPVPGVDLAAA